MQKLAENEYEMVLTDVTMPGLDGFQLLQHVSNHYPEIAVMMITGVSDINLAVRALSNGAYDYVTKPFNLLDLKSKIDNALHRAGSCARTGSINFTWKKGWKTRLPN